MRVQVGDGRLFFDVEGAKLVPDGPKMRERPTLLLLHGGPGFDHSNFKPDLSPLAEVAQVIYLDHRSNGRSDRTPPDRWTLANWADDVRAFCEALEIEKPIVMGTSFGGFVAMAYGTRHPEHPGKLIFCTTSAKWRLSTGARRIRTHRRQGSARRGEKLLGESQHRNRSPTTSAFAIPLYNHNRRGNEMFTRSVMNMEVVTRFPAPRAEQLRLSPRPQAHQVSDAGAGWRGRSDHADRGFRGYRRGAAEASSCASRDFLRLATAS